VRIEFHAQHSALKKQYGYYFQQGPAAVPHLNPYSWWIKKPLDVAAMNAALEHLKGEHDFKPFQGAGSKPMLTTVRTILEAEVVALANEGAFPLPFAGNRTVRIRVVGTGFLKHMVRGIAGTLLEVGTGKRPASDMAEILRRQDRSFVGPTASAQGLWMERVWYENVSFGPVSD
jgi:tRNA pseudouridine38-40 synthase